MKAFVVYESLWGNTAAVARAIAEGIGAEARALSTDEATAAEIAGAELIVAGAPLLAFRLPTEQIRESIRNSPNQGPKADFSHPSMRAWLATLPAGTGRGRYAAFETRLRWSPGGATKTIAQGLETAGYREALKARRFLVKGRYGPLRDGELENARAWGAELARAIA
jgi:hypothetical protein